MIKKIFLILFVFVLFVYLIYSNFEGVRNMAGKSLLSVTSYVTNSFSLFEILRNKKSLLEENKKLRKDLNLLKYERISNLSLRQDIAEFKKLFSGIDTGDADSYFITRLEPSVAPRVNYLLLGNRPDENDYYVLGPNSFLLAYLPQGSNKEARLYGGNFKITPAYIIQKDKKIKVSLKGKGSGTFTFELNKEYDLKVGDVVYYKSMPIAVVLKIENDDQSPYRIVYASLPVNINNLDFVLLKKAHD